MTPDRNLGMIDVDLVRKVAADFEATKKMFREDQLAVFEAAMSAAQNAAAVIPDSFFRRAVEAATDYARLHKQLIEGLALEQEFLPKMAAHGWLISPLGPVSYT